MENDEYVFLKFMMMLTHVCIPIPNLIFENLRNRK